MSLIFHAGGSQFQVHTFGVFGLTAHILEVVLHFLVLLSNLNQCPERIQKPRPMQTDATLLANNTQHCWAQHVASVCMEPQQCWHLLALVAYSLKPIKRLGLCKRTQHCSPETRNNVMTCCVLLYGPLQLEKIKHSNYF